VAVVLGVVSLLWLTDRLHHLHPAVPALVALVALVSPGVGVLTWQELERDMSWSTFFVLGVSLSLAQALMSSGAATWLAGFLAVGVRGLAANPLLFLISLMLPATVVRLAVPSLAGYLALTIPVGVSLAQQVGVNPVVVSLALLITGDAVLYYPAQSPSSLLVYQRGHLTAGEIFRFGVVMTLVAYTVLLVVALTYWSLLGEGLFQ
jgi:di/tricarboxylate transporter